MDRHLRQDKQEKEDREEEGKILGTGHMRPLASAGRAYREELAWREGRDYCFLS